VIYASGFSPVAPRPVSCNLFLQKPYDPADKDCRLGLIGAPSRIAQALAPLAFGLLLEPVGRGVVVVSAGLSLAAPIALMLLQVRSETIKAAAAAE
jgi:hypothetical protein